MPRVVHYRVFGASEELLPELHQRFEELAAAREWRGERPFLASDLSRDLLGMEYIRLQREADGESLSAAGYIKLGGDEIDFLVLAIFMRDLSADHAVRAALRDEGHPLAKLRYLEFRGGRLPSGNSLEEMLARRPVMKKVQEDRITFYPPAHELHAGSPARPGEWGYHLSGLRAYAPTLIEAEREALKILRGWRHLGD